MFSFNLITENWIPVKTLSGEIKEVSLKDALLKARDYKRIEDPSPLVVASLHRFLLAVLHRALKGPTEVSQNVEWFKNGFSEKDISDYLDKWKDRFDLFHPKYPFYQVADLPESYTKHWRFLSAELGSGSTTVLYNYSKRASKPTLDYSIFPKNIVKYILEHQTFTLQGTIQRILVSQSGAPSTTAAILICLGENLHETYTLNLIPYSIKEAEIDIPAWERKSEKMNLDYMKGKKKKNKKDQDINEGVIESINGFTNLYTWISRSIKLIPELVNSELVIRDILYASGVSIKRDKNSNPFFDPMVTYKTDFKKGLISISLNKDKAFWRDFDSILLPQENSFSRTPKNISNAAEVYDYLNKSEPIKISVFGQSTDNMKIEFYRNENYNIPMSILKSRKIKEGINEALEKSEKTFYKLKEATFYLLILIEPKFKDEEKGKIKLLWYKVSNPPPIKEQPIISKLRETIQKLPSTLSYWSSLESHFTTFLQNFDSESNIEDNMNWWLQKLIETVNDSWQDTCDSIGISGDSIKAMAIAKRTIDSHCSYLNKLINGEENV